MADNFAQLSAEPRYVVEGVDRPVSVADLQKLSESWQRKAEAAEASLPDLEQARNAARATCDVKRVAVASTAAEAATIRQQWMPTEAAPAGPIAGRKHGRSAALPPPPPALVEANSRHHAARTAERVADSALAAAEGALRGAQQSVRDTAARAAHLCSIASEIAEGEEFVPVSLEDDAVQGVWAAECFRWQRRAAPSPPPRAQPPKLCTKASPTVKGFTPGLFVLSCPHGYVYFLKLLRRGESPQVYYDFLRDRCRPGHMPGLVCYDNGCNLDSYIASRSPELTAMLTVIIDRLHARNHVHCSSCYQLDRYTDFDKSRDFNTQVAEHGNRPIQRAAPSIRSSTPLTAITTLSSLAMVLSSLRLQRNPAAVPLVLRHPAPAVVHAVVEEGGDGNDGDVVDDSDAESDVPPDF